MTTSTDHYMHGSSEEEQDRLVLMNALLNPAALEVMGLEGGERVLDVGAGTGLFAAELARAAGPRGRVLAIERDPHQARSARARAATLEQPFEVREGDAYAPPLADEEQASFDLVHARFLLEHLDQPARAVEPMVRAARPGGRIALVDDDHSLMRFEPDPGGMRELWESYCRLYERLGKDPWIGTRLVKLLADAGARPLSLGWIPYGGCAGDPSFAGLVENLARVMEGVRELLLQDPSGAWTRPRLDDVLRAFRDWGRRPDAALWYPLPWAVAVRP